MIDATMCGSPEIGTTFLRDTDDANTWETVDAVLYQTCGNHWRVTWRALSDHRRQSLDTRYARIVWDDEYSCWVEWARRGGTR
jgi:3-methyladenine DNA glycosylase AlkD